MEVIEEFLNGAKLLKPRIFKDARGYFFESYNQNTFSELGINARFVQDNESYSARGVLRGLHFQKGANCQAKLVRVLEGLIEDVIVDLRLGSPSFGRFKKITLNGEEGLTLFVPRGFAHGFLVLSDGAKVFYKCDNFYNPSYEGGIRFDDPSLNIDWSLEGLNLSLSDKDSALASFEDYRKEPIFEYGK